MEFKWLTIAFMVILGTMFLGLAAQQYTEGQCLKTYATSNKTAEEIRKICTGR